MISVQSYNNQLLKVISIDFRKNWPKLDPINIGTLAFVFKRDEGFGTFTVDQLLDWALKKEVGRMGSDEAEACLLYLIDDCPPVYRFVGGKKRLHRRGKSIKYGEYIFGKVREFSKMKKREGQKRRQIKKYIKWLAMSQKKKSMPPKVPISLVNNGDPATRTTNPSATYVPASSPNSSVGSGNACSSSYDFDDESIPYVEVNRSGSESSTPRSGGYRFWRRTRHQSTSSLQNKKPGSSDSRWQRLRSKISSPRIRTRRIRTRVNSPRAMFAKRQNILSKSEPDMRKLSSSHVDKKASILSEAQRLELAMAKSGNQLQHVINDPEMFKVFHAFLKIEISDEHLDFCAEVNRFKMDYPSLDWSKMSTDVRADFKTRIVDVFLHDDALRQVNLDHTIRLPLCKVFDTRKPSEEGHDLGYFVERARHAIFNLLSNDSFRRFLLQDPVT